MSRVEAFFRDLDQRWTVPVEGPITLRLVGSTALMLQTDYVRGTKDGDVLETPEIQGAVGAALLALGGPGTALARRHGMYVELLGAAFPFLPDAPRWHPVTSFEAPLAQFRVEVLDVVDVSVAKLARFHRADQEDIAAMVERGLVTPGALLDRFRSAVDRWSLDARAEDLPRIRRNFHRVQRDVLFVDEAEVELPAWVADD
jgi:hypothetical protein